MTVVSNANGKIWLALKSHIETWTECYVMFPEDNYAPDATETYLIVQNVLTDYGGTIPVSIQCGRPFSGIINLSVLRPSDMGYDGHIGLAGRVADHFQEGSALRYDDIEVRINGRPRVIGNVSLQAPWNRLEVQVPFLAWG